MPSRLRLSASEPASTTPAGRARPPRYATLCFGRGWYCPTRSDDLAALAGFCAQAAVRPPSLLLDGMAVTAAALVAERLAPGARHWWQAGHRSTEPGHGLALAALELDPILDL